MNKLETLNSIHTIGCSLASGTLANVFAEKSWKCINILHHAGFSNEQINESMQSSTLFQDRRFVDLFYLAKKYTKAVWWAPDTGFTEYKRKCKVCGCTDFDGCNDGCYWVSDDLCSSCI